VEAESHFDEHGGPRNHDAVVHGHLPDGSRIVVCVEAKAGEALGQTVEQYAKAAHHNLEKNKPTDAPKRLEKLLERYADDYDGGDDRVREGCQNSDRAWLTGLARALRGSRDGLVVCLSRVRVAAEAAGRLQAHRRR
jgi:hypothetical protein